MEVDTNKQGSLSVLCKFSFAANCPHNRLLQWSHLDRLLALNLTDKLLIFEINPNFAINYTYASQKLWVDQNMRCSYATIRSSDPFKFNVGHAPKRYNTDLIVTEPLQSTPEFLDFAFAPADLRRSCNLLATLTSDYCLSLHLQVGSLQWHSICIVSEHLVQYNLKQHKWSLAIQNDLETFFERLESVWITAFCWHPQVVASNQTLQYTLYFATKNDDLFRGQFTLDGTDKGEFTTQFLYRANLGQVACMAIYDNVLVLGFDNGLVKLFDLNDIAGGPVEAWKRSDNLPCSEFEFFKSSDQMLLHIVFAKSRRIVVVSVNHGQDVPHWKCTVVVRLVDREVINISRINLQGGQFMVTSLSEPSLHCISINDSGVSLRSVEVNEVMPSDDQCFHGVATSSSGALTALVLSHKQFSAWSHYRATNMTLYLCASLTPSDVGHYLVNQLITSPHFFTNSCYDLLYLFRYWLVTNQTSQQSVLTALLENWSFTMERFTSANPSLEVLYHIKLTRFLVRRFWELSIDGLCQLYDQPTKSRLYDMLQRMDKLILAKTFDYLFNHIIELDEENLEQYTFDQLVSLYNLTQQDLLPVFSPMFTSRLISMVKQQPIKSLKQYREVKDMQLNATRSLLDNWNQCPFCERTLDDDSVKQAKCTQLHRVDICSNSLVPIHPLRHDLDLCCRCFESKLLTPRPWPSPTLAPYHYTYDYCFLCL